MYITIYNMAEILDITASRRIMNLIWIPRICGLYPDSVVSLQFVLDLQC